MNKKRSSFLSMGIPSMCIIFSVLCLVILALLTLGTSRQDLQTSQLTLDQTTAYYTACSTASGQYQELIKYAKNSLADSKDQQGYNTKMSSVTKQYATASWDESAQTLSFTVDFTEEQAIYIEVSIPYPSGTSGKDRTLSPEILTWKTISTADWNPDTRQPVYKGDTK